MLLKEFCLQFMSDYPEYSSPEETGKSFEENATIKATSFWKFLKSKPVSLQNVWIIGEDSGLEVLALNKAPGIYSARYKNAQASDEENLHHLLYQMRDVAKNKRQARFVCHIVALSEGKKWSVQGIVKGQIMTESYYQQLEKQRGLNKRLWPVNWPRFGYDPVFIPEGQERSFFDLGVDYKNCHSHRFQAVKKLKLMLERCNSNQLENNSYG